jgi:hypothetical protein
VRSITVTNVDLVAITGSNLFSINSKPTINSMSLYRLDRGDTNQDVIITGENFSSSNLDFGTNMTVSSVTVVSATKITAKLSVAPDATYGSRDVRVINGDGGKSDTVSFKVAPKLIINNIRSTNINTTSTIITWTTSNKAATKIIYGISNNYLKSYENITKVYNHGVTLTNLPIHLVHFFKIIAEDEFGQVEESIDQLFTAGILPIPQAERRNLQVSESELETIIDSEDHYKKLNGN